MARLITSSLSIAVPAGSSIASIENETRLQRNEDRLRLVPILESHLVARQAEFAKRHELTKQGLKTLTADDPNQQVFDGVREEYKMARYRIIDHCRF